MVQMKILHSESNIDNLDICLDKRTLMLLLKFQLPENTCSLDFVACCQALPIVILKAILP